MDIPHAYEIKFMTWNLKYDEARARGVGHGGPKWDERVEICARTILRECCDVFCTQEDTMSMNSRLSRCINECGSGYDNSISYSRYPEELYIDNFKVHQYRELSDDGKWVESKGTEKEHFLECCQNDEYFQNSLYANAVWFDNKKIGLVNGGIYRFMTPAIKNSECRFRTPVTWAMLRRKCSKPNECDLPIVDDKIIVVCVHLPAGHGWLDQMPYKIDIAKCVRHTIAELQITLDASEIPIFVMGDFNSQKIQNPVKILTGSSRLIVVDTVDTVGAKEPISVVNRDVLDMNFFKQYCMSDQKSEWRNSFADFVDCFDCVGEDNPIMWPSEPSATPYWFRNDVSNKVSSYDMTERIRTGGLNGTTWHDWNGPQHSIQISNSMAQACKHAAGEMKFNDVTSKSIRAQALGHERHIDHIYIVRGKGVRPKIVGDTRTLTYNQHNKKRQRLATEQPITEYADLLLPTRVQPKVRVRNCKVILDIARTDFTYDSETETRDIKTIWGSDHFPVTTTVIVSKFHDENETKRRRLASLKTSAYRVDNEDDTSNGYESDDRRNYYSRCMTP